MLRSALRATAAVAAIIGVAELIRRLTRDAEDAPLPSTSVPAGRTRAPAPASPARPPKPAPKRTPAPATSPTRKELYEEAQRLEIRGRSSMSKEELVEALRQAK